jgi:hypothetical protein
VIQSVKLKKYLFGIIVSRIGIIFATDRKNKYIVLCLMDFASDRAKELGGKRISIGLIDSNIILKKWYGRQGYVVVEIKKFEHLPFDVCFMEKEIYLK